MHAQRNSRPARGLQLVGDEVEERGLAGPIGAHDAHALACIRSAHTAHTAHAQPKAAVSASPVSCFTAHTRVGHGQQV